MIFIGIDNGTSGGIGALSYDGVNRPSLLAGAWPMPPTEADILARLAALKEWGEGFTEGQRGSRRAFAMLEHAQAFPRMGRSGAFNYGAGYGAMQMALVAVGIPFSIVTPSKWQRAMGCLTGGDKNVSKRHAERLFPCPGLRITHAIADALLIAEYCRRVHSPEFKR